MSKYNILTAPQPNRYVLFPLKYHKLWEHYKRAVSTFWTAEEIDFSHDLNDWDKLKDEEQHFIKHVLAFFASSDGIVLENLAVRFMKDIEIPEARCFYGFQIAIENIHSEVYSLLINTYIKDADEKEILFHAAENLDCVKQKAEWACKWINDETSSFVKRLVAFAVVEGVFFSGSFCAIYWLKERGVMHGLTFSNELISRDEGFHTDFACELYNMLEVDKRLSEEEMEELFREAVAIEKNFILEAIPCKMIGMNQELMSQYIEYVADRLLVQLEHKKIWGTTNPFSFMEFGSMRTKTNFFEKRVAEYVKAGVGSKKENSQFALTDDY